MENEHQPDWDPASEESANDQRAAYDKIRETYPVAHSEFCGWTLFQHEDLARQSRNQSGETPDDLV